MASKKIQNTIDEYMLWRGELSFNEAPFNPVDNIIFSILVYLDFKNFVSDDENKAKTFKSIIRAIPKGSDQIKAASMFDQKIMIGFAQKAAKTKRFGNIKVMAYENVIDEKKIMQFAALTFLLPDGTVYVAFRGTDNTIAGWKEDFRMSYEVVPSQKYAEKYLEEICKKLKYKKIRVGGHSKGGNLALWSVLNLNKRLQHKIIDIYTNDAPGFDNSIFESEDYIEIRDRTHMYVASESIVGMIFGQDDNYKIINSFENAYMQHDPFSWEVLGSDFVYLNQRSSGAKKLEKKFSNWLKSMGKNEREDLTEMIFSVLEAPNVKTLSELGDFNLHNIETMSKAIISMDKEDKKRLAQYIKLFLKY